MQGRSSALHRCFGSWFVRHARRDGLLRRRAVRQYASQRVKMLPPGRGRREVRGARSSNQALSGADVVNDNEVDAANLAAVGERLTGEPPHDAQGPMGHMTGLLAVRGSRSSALLNKHSPRCHRGVADLLRQREVLTLRITTKLGRDDLDRAEQHLHLQIDWASFEETLLDCRTETPRGAKRASHHLANLAIGDQVHAAFRGEKRAVVELDPVTFTLLELISCCEVKANERFLHGLNCSTAQIGPLASMLLVSRGFFTSSA
jgi:hypothetical protein